MNLSREQRLQTTWQTVGHSASLPRLADWLLALPARAQACHTPGTGQEAFATTQLMAGKQAEEPWSEHGTMLL